MKSIEDLTPEDQSKALAATKHFAAWYIERQKAGTATSTREAAAFLQQLAPGLVASVVLVELLKSGGVQLGAGNRRQRRAQLVVLEGGKGKGGDASG